MPDNNPLIMSYLDKADAGNSPEQRWEVTGLERMGEKGGWEWRGIGEDGELVGRGNRRKRNTKEGGWEWRGM